MLQLCVASPRQRRRARPDHGAGAAARLTTLRFALAILPLVSQSACGGGGGGGGGGSGSFGSPASFETTEYNASYGLGAIGASTAYSVGANGRGVEVGVVDTGIDVDHPEFAGAIDGASIDIISGNASLVDDTDGHGTAVAGVIAARKNDALTHGVAFRSRILAVRADDPGSCATECAFFPTDIAAATDYAVARGADVVNYSIGGLNSLSATLQNALANAVDDGAILVFSAGNDSAAEPTLPARFAANAQADGQAIAVGAVDSDNQIAAFSNHAGSVQNQFLVAPGVQVLAPAVGGGAALVSGTSFAAPHVSGAAAVLLDAAPFLSAADVVRLLLESATDLGATGTDAIYGRGLLNIAAALRPAGALSVPLGGSVDDGGGDLAETRLRLGGAFGPGPDLGRAIFVDGYGRPYWFEIDDRVGTAAAGFDLLPWLMPGDGATSLRLPLAPGLGLTMHLAGVSDAPPPGAQEAATEERFALTTAIGDGHQLIVSRGWGLQHQFGLTGIDGHASQTLLGQGGFTSPYLALTDGGDGLGIRQQLGDGYRLQFGLVMERQSGQERGDGGSTLLVGELVRQSGDGSRIGLQLGGLVERRGMLDSTGAGALGLAEHTATEFLGLNGHLSVSDRWQLFAQGSFGVTRPGSANGLLGSISPLVSSGFGAGVTGRDLLSEGDGMTVAIAQPLRLEAGSVVVDRPVGRTFDGRISRRSDRVTLVPKGREIDLELAYRFVPDGLPAVRINWLTQLQPGHDRSAAPQHALGLKFETRF